MDLREVLELRKAKYLKRTGGPGSYKYTYKEAQGKSKWYLGHAGGKHEAFSSKQEPTQETHGQYGAVVGPFRTKRAAMWAQEHGQGNPHFQHVRDAERISSKEKKEGGKSSKEKKGPGEDLPKLKKRLKELDAQIGDMKEDDPELKDAEREYQKTYNEVLRILKEE